MCEAPTISGETEFVESFENFETSSYFVSSGTCYDVESTNSIYVKESIGQYLGSSGTICVPFDGDKQIAVYYNTSGTISRLFYLQAGHTTSLQYILVWTKHCQLNNHLYRCSTLQSTLILPCIQ